MATDAQMNQLQGLYIAYFGRPADAAGVSYWTAQFDGGATIDQIADRFMESDEFTATSSDLSDVVSAAYTNALGRTAGAEEVAFWVGQIEAGNQTVASLLEAFRSTDDATDSQTLENKITVANAYTAAAVAGANFDTAASVALLASVDATPASVDAALEEIGAEVPVEAPSEALEALAVAEGEVADFVKAWGVENDQANPTPTLINGAVDTAEAAIDTFLLASSFTSVTGLTYDLIGANDVDAVEDASLNLIMTTLATERAALVTTATTAGNNANTAKAGLKAAVDSYVTAAAATVTAVTAEASANNEFAGAALQFGLDNPTLANGDVQFAYSGGILTVWDEDGANAGYVPAEDEAIATFDGTSWTDGASAVAASSSLKAAAEKYYAVAKALESAEAREVATLRVIEDLDANQTDATSVVNVDGTTALTGQALAYATAAAALATFDADMVELQDLVSAIEAARTDSAELAVLTKAVVDATKALDDAGYNVAPLANAAAQVATAEDDVFTLSSLVDDDAVSIFNFGALGNDLLVAGNYVQGAALNAGDNSVLEFFVNQVGADTVLTFETSPFGSSAVAQEAFTVTLVGVPSADVVFQDGYITVA